MADRYPLIVDSSTNTVKELPSGDKLNLEGAGLANAGVSTFTGDLFIEGNLRVGTGATTSYIINGTTGITSSTDTGVKLISVDTSYSITGASSEARGAALRDRIRKLSQTRVSGGSTNTTGIVVTLNLEAGVYHLPEPIVIDFAPNYTIKVVGASGIGTIPGTDGRHYYNQAGFKSGDTPGISTVNAGYAATFFADLTASPNAYPDPIPASVGTSNTISRPYDRAIVEGYYQTKVFTESNIGFYCNRSNVRFYNIGFINNLKDPTGVGTTLTVGTTYNNDGSHAVWGINGADVYLDNVGIHDFNWGFRLDGSAGRMDHTFVTSARNAIRILTGSSCGIGSTSGSISGYYNCVVDNGSSLNFQRDLDEFRGHRSFFTNGVTLGGISLLNGSSMGQVSQASAAICIGNNAAAGLYLNDGSTASLYNDFSTHGNGGEGIVANNGSSVQYRASSNAYSESPLKMGFMCIDNDSRGVAASYNSSMFIYGGLGGFPSGKIIGNGGYGSLVQNQSEAYLRTVTPYNNNGSTAGEGTAVTSIQIASHLMSHTQIVSINGDYASATGLSPDSDTEGNQNSFTSSSTTIT